MTETRTAPSEKVVKIGPDRVTIKSDQVIIEAKHEMPDWSVRELNHVPLYFGEDKYYLVEKAKSRPPYAVRYTLLPWPVGQSTSAKGLYTYDLDYYLDDTTPIRRMRQTAHISQDEKRLRFDAFELQAEPGVGLSTGQGQSPVAQLSWSNNGGHTWSHEHEASMGAIGQYGARLKWRRLGIGRDRVFRVTTSEPVPVTWLGAEIDVVQLGS